MSGRSVLAFCVAAASVVAGQSHADVVYDTGQVTGYYTPFSSSTPAGTKFGDSGWFGSGSDPAVPITSIRLGLAVDSSSAVAAGTTDIVFTMNDGDPSGQVFGTAQQLYSTTITGVQLPATNGFGPVYFDLTIPIPSVSTLGGFNNIGWSVGVQNFNYSGQFGFQNCGSFNALGFYTNNASEYDPGPGWHLFAFGPNSPGDIANFSATVSTPEPGTFTGLAIIGMLAARRKRSA